MLKVSEMSSVKLVVVTLCLVGVCFVASTAGKTVSEDAVLASVLQDSEVYTLILCSSYCAN